MRKLILFLVICAPIFAFSAEIPKRTLTAERTEMNIKIDGNLDEEDWVGASIADKFTTLSPTPGNPAAFETQVRILYDDDAIYIGAIMIDPEPEKIMKQLTSRDNTGNASFFHVILDTYKSGINGFAFAITSAGVQADFKLTPEGEDENWDAVWKSDVKITEFGWVAELEIPYSALRFPDVEIQEWSINFGREVRRNRETSFWNEIDPKIDGLLVQAGLLNGIKNIKTPVRLMVTPYLSYGGSFNAKQEGTLSTGISGGMDLKYGINDAFTLDMTLIPDFSQVRFDEQVLNLTPFEVQFDENRAFFTEGTELFDKAGLFYSRRIGGSPHNLGAVYDLQDQGLEVTKYNNETQLLNASKLSGRTNSGLGLGLFNAIVGRNLANYIDENGEEQRVETNPLTNYSVLVADQQLKNNSYFSLINTNVTRVGSAYDANVTGTEFSFRTEDQKYQLAGASALSQKYFSEETDLGYMYTLSMDKIRGNVNYGIEYKEESPDYDINDLGFIRRPNERSVEARTSFNNFNPKSKYINRSSLRIRSEYQRLVNPNVFTDFSITAIGFVRTKNFIGTGGWVRLEPVNTFDYFEARTSDYSQFYHYPKNFMIGNFISTNSGKAFTLNINTRYRVFNEKGRNSLQFDFRPRWRVSDRLSVDWSYTWDSQNEDVGYISNSIEVPNVDNPVIFGKRDRNTSINEFTAQIIFTENMYINLIGRHYWSKVNYNSYHLLGNEGELISNPINDVDEDGRKIYDVNFNLLNMDLVYNWRFAPGSDLVFVVKNFANNGEDVRDLRSNYLNSVNSVYNYNNNFSVNLKVLYFLDYYRLSNGRA